ncbi:uncharacterized protein LOC106078009 isoform X1 [Biomphalaria glabrata]|uniref:Uncharacterized protein LOC106078009 isoform X1 n=1 Tax=Biomphalaria glabrata TaxID=6526 RepID=A0A9W3BE25_BIOGL|nr:uncharacterized protein LOC106078009 isoform X1 [Biomphalaria glabrata]XP_055897682.1 uncharacterized protein LOC106078009 isoform X1 [Biomphalaria glabrata]XP_055897683.1 uncharacterized protein LOC106078009 isoform X1 [Biomphalaria glabrata]XP_055897684.1 uncharacterized protein LOC106078009 isoform X1 [Biomphalaria glabrata]XP_055897686.1 uncharacterized protein LOC106078009 isoform X1 [Biomphalaria glabrata]
MDVKNGDLQGEVKLDIGSVCSDYSHTSKISHRSSQSTRKSATAISSISNRARRIKEYEDQGCTSLSVDLKPGDENNLDSIREARSSSRISLRSSTRSAATTRVPSVQSSGWMKSVADLDLSSRLMSSGLLRPQSSKSYTTLLQNPPKSNSKVKMPFKHNTNKPDVTTVVVSPGREMSELTVLATSVINKVLKEQKPPKINHVQGRLLKARLKPLDPVSVTSPTIQQCRGIIAETRAYGASSSRTFQRWKAIMSGSHRFIHPDVDLKDSMSLGESVHRTSQATSPVPSEDMSPEGYHETIGSDLQDGIKEDFESFINTTVSKSDEHPALSDEGPSKSKRLTEVLPEDILTVTNDAKINTETKSGVKGDEESEVASSATPKIAGNKRPRSAFFPHDPFDPDSLRPKTTGDNIRPKSVRFADENKKPPDSSGSAPLVKKADDKENKNKSKTSCRPHSESGIRSHDPDDHNGSDPRDIHRFTYSDKLKANIGQQGSDSKQSFSNGNSNSPSDTLEITTESNSQVSETSEDKQILSMPKAATVLFETGNDPNVKQQQHTRNTTMNIKTHLGVKSSNYKQKRKLPIDQSFASKNIEQKERIHHTNSTLRKDPNLHASNEKKLEQDSSLEFSHLKSDNAKCNITHLPPKGSNVNLPHGHKKSLKKAPHIKDRPFSASSYINKDIVERKPRVHSASKPARAADANIFIEKNGILSRHGLLGKKRPASAPSTTSCNILKNDSQSTESKSKSCGKQLKEKPHKKTSKRRERDLTLNTDSAADVDKMWEELPEDDEDNFQDDLFLSKFKQLENELELNKAALQTEKLKCSMSQVIDSGKNLIEVLEPENLSVSGSSPVIIPGEILQEDDIDDEDEIACDGSIIRESTLDQQPAEAEPETTISCNLYKKTNLFVPISKRRQNKLKDSTRKNVRRGSVPKSTTAVDETNNVSSCNHEKSVNRAENGSEVLNEHVIENLCETAAALLQGSGETNTKDVIDAHAIQKQLKETRKQLELDYPHLTKHFEDHVSQSLGVKRVMASHGFQQASDPDILYQGDLYNSLLQAYRHHFDISNEENDDDFDEGITTTSKKVQLHPKSELLGVSKHQGRNLHHGSGAGLKNQNAVDYSNILEGSTMTKSRPWSGTTNDSGLEADVLSNDEEDEIEAVNETTLIKHSAQNASTTEAHEDNADPLSNANKNHKTEREDSLTEFETTSSALEIVAQAKKLSKSKKKSRHYEDMSTLSQVPPLCFRLNAKPPSGHLFYFAYDQNMSMDRMTTYLSAGEPLVRFWSLLFGFELVFNKKAGVNSDLQDVGGFPNLAYNAKSSVEGCLYQLTPGQLECLDKFMGYPQNCDHIVLPVWMSNCTNPEDLGVAQYCVPACTYIAKDDMTWTTPIEPNDFALTQCIKAADLLTPSYRDHLATISKSLSSSSLFTENSAVLSVTCVA